MLPPRGHQYVLHVPDLIVRVLEKHFVCEPIKKTFKKIIIAKKKSGIFKKEMVLGIHMLWCVRTRLACNKA